MPGSPGAVHGLLLAAGAGVRAGGPKALRRDPDGTSWLARSVQVLLTGGCAEVAVVLGSGAAGARALLETRAAEPLGGVRTVVAPDWASGPGRSLACGLRTVTAAGVEAVAVHLVDLPDVGPPVVARLLAETGPDRLSRAVYAGRPGHPVLLGAAHLDPLLAFLESHDGQTGAATYLREHGVRDVECGDLATGLDQDGPRRA